AALPLYPRDPRLQAGRSDGTVAGRRSDRTAPDPEQRPARGDGRDTPRRRRRSTGEAAARRAPAALLLSAAQGGVRMAVLIGAAAKAAASAGGALFRGGILMALALVAPAFAQSGAPDRAAGVRAGGEGACEFARGVAAAEADVLLGPELF